MKIELSHFLMQIREQMLKNESLGTRQETYAAIR